jgi:hypothetical protein
MNRKNAQNSLNDIPTRVGIFRARRVAAGTDGQAAGDALPASRTRAKVVRRVLVAAGVAYAMAALPAMAESCEARCQQVREEGFSTMTTPEGATVLCCCLVGEAEQSQSKPLEECGKIP